jgi:outer membrane protein, multidrug efflux system
MKNRMRMNRCSNPKGIVSFSPGLRDTSYPGSQAGFISTPAGLCRVSAGEPQPRWGCLRSTAFPRVARASQPWAWSRNPVGIQQALTVTLFLTSRLVVLISVCAIVLILSGCALSKPPAHSQLVTNALPTGTTIPQRWSSPAATNAVADDWLKSFHDPRLDSLVVEAITNNLDLRQAAARVEVARQNVIVVGSQLQPQVGVNLGLGATRDDGNDDWYKSKRGLAGVAWEPDVWGRLRAQREAAKAGYQATTLDYSFARQSLAATAAKSWYLTIETRQLVGLAAQSVAIYSNLLDLVKIRRAAGKVTDLDVAEAAADLNAAQGQLRVNQGLYSDARRSLEVLLGRYPAAELAVAESFTPVPPPVQAGLPSSLLERRPDIAAAGQLVLAAFRTEESAKLALLPSFSLNLDGGKLSDNLLSMLQINPWMFSAAVGMHVPIYTGGALRAQIRIATAQQQQAIAGYGSVALTAFREVENALTSERLLTERLQFQQAEVRDRVEAVRIARLQYQAGAIDLLSVLQLQSDQIASEANLIRLRNAQLANRIGLHLALGGSFESAPAMAPVVAGPAAAGTMPDR